MTTARDAYIFLRKQGLSIDKAKLSFERRYGGPMNKEVRDMELIDLIKHYKSGGEGPEVEAQQQPEPEPKLPPGEKVGDQVITPEASLKIDKESQKVFKERPGFSFVDDIVEPTLEIGAKAAGIAGGLTGAPTTARIINKLHMGFEADSIGGKMKELTKKISSLDMSKPGAESEFKQLVKTGETLKSQLELAEKTATPDTIRDTWQQMKKTSKERMGKDFYDNWTASTAQLKESTIHLLSQLADVGEKDETVGAGMKRAFFEGLNLPDQLVGAMVGMTAHVIRHPIDSWTTQPGETLLVFAPFLPKLFSAAKGGSAGAAAALADLKGTPGVMAGLKRMGYAALDELQPGFKALEMPVVEGLNKLVLPLAEKLTSAKLGRVRPKKGAFEPIKKIPVEEVTPGKFTRGERAYTVGDVVAASLKGGFVGLLVDEASSGALLAPLIGLIRAYNPSLNANGLKTWLVDNAHNSDSRLSALTRRVIKEPEIVAEEVRRHGEELIREVDKDKSRPAPPDDGTPPETAVPREPRSRDIDYVEFLDDEAPIVDVIPEPAPPTPRSPIETPVEFLDEPIVSEAIVQEFIEARASGNAGTGSGNAMTDVWQGVAQLNEMIGQIPREMIGDLIVESMGDVLANLELLDISPDGYVKSTGGKIASKATLELMPEFPELIQKIKNHADDGNIEGALSELQNATDMLKEADAVFKEAIEGIPPARVTGPRKFDTQEQFDAAKEKALAESDTGIIEQGTEAASVQTITNNIDMSLGDLIKAKTRLERSMPEESFNRMKETEAALEADIISNVLELPESKRLEVVARLFARFDEAGAPQHILEQISRIIDESVGRRNEQSAAPRGPIDEVTFLDDEAPVVDVPPGEAPPGGLPVPPETQTVKGERLSAGGQLEKKLTREVSLELPDNPAIRKIVDTIAKMFPEEEAAIRHILANVLSNESSIFLKNANVLNKVAAIISKRSGMALERVRLELKSAISQFESGVDMNTLVIGPDKIKLWKVITEVVSKDKQFMKSAISEVVGRLSEKALQNRRTKMIEELSTEASSRMVVGPDGVPARVQFESIGELANHIATMDLMGTPVSVIPTVLKNGVKVTVKEIMRELSEERLTEIKEQVAKLDEGSTGNFDYNVNQMRNRILKFVERDGVLMDKGVAKALDWHNAVIKNITDKDGAWRAFNQAVKRNLTVNNSTSTINNSNANIVLQTIRRGLTPVEYISNIVRIGIDYYNLKRNPEKLKPDTKAKLEAIQETGVVATDAVAVELGFHEGAFADMFPDSWRGRGPSIPSGVKTFIETVTHRGKLAQKAYHFGDVLPKLEESMRNIDKTIEQLNELKPGEDALLMVDRNVVVRVVKTQTGFMIQGKHYTSMMEKGALKIVAKAAVRLAQNLFFDYGDTGRLGKILRSAPIIGVASLFFTWSSKALFGEGGGLVGNVLGDSNVIVQTSSKTLQNSMLRDGAALSFRRGMAANAQDRELSLIKDKIRSLISWNPELADAIIIGHLNNPAFLTAKSIGSWSFDGPFNTALRIAMGAVNKYKGAPKPSALLNKDISPEDKRRFALFMKYQSGERGSTKDALDLIGLAGTPILDAWNLIYNKNEDKFGNPISPDRILAKFGGAIIGGTLFKEVEVAFGAADSGILEQLPRGAELDMPNLKDTFPDWSIRKLTGIGLRKTLMVPAGKREGSINNYLNGVENALMGQLVRGQKKKAMSLFKVGRDDEARRLMTDASMWEAVIAKTVGEMRGEIFQVLGLLKKYDEKENLNE